MTTETSSTEIKHDIVVTAKSVFLDDYSKTNKYLFCYQITIHNQSKEKVKLLNRHWIIIDSNSHKDEVKGSGVLGQQPELEPGASHQYLSFCSLDTNFGTMEGTYEFIDSHNNTFLVQIPRFFLAQNLNEFEKAKFPRGTIVRHKIENFIAVVTDYDMYFINDEEVYQKDKDAVSKNQPWYYVLIHQTNAISYVAQERLEELTEKIELEHPLLDFFFDGFNGENYTRNDKTWDELKRF